MRLAAGAAVVAICSGAVAAQEQLTPDGFIDRAVGNTLTFDQFDDGSRVGIEQFLTRVRSVWSRSDGTCTYGDITLQGAYVCFRYNDQPDVSHCWVPYEFEDRLFVQSIDGEVQEITRISKAPVIYTDAPLS